MSHNSSFRANHESPVFASCHSHIFRRRPRESCTVPVLVRRWSVCLVWDTIPITRARWQPESNRKFRRMNLVHLAIESLKYSVAVGRRAAQRQYRRQFPIVYAVELSSLISVKPSATGGVRSVACRSLEAAVRVYARLILFRRFLHQRHHLFAPIMTLRNKHVQ